eukprot:UN07317
MKIQTEYLYNITQVVITSRTITKTQSL